MKKDTLLEITARIRAIAQNGLAYSTNEYDKGRYGELMDLSNRMTADISKYTLDEIKACFRLEDDYVTPKVDVRAVIFNEEGKILLVQEKSDGCWSLPGGWADVGYSPTEVTVKEMSQSSAGSALCL